MVCSARKTSKSNVFGLFFAFSLFTYADMAYNKSGVPILLLSNMPSCWSSKFSKSTACYPIQGRGEADDLFAAFFACNWVEAKAAYVDVKAKHWWNYTNFLILPHSCSLFFFIIILSLSVQE